MSKKGSYFQFKTDTIDTTIEYCTFELVLYQISLWTILNFWTKFAQERYSWSKTEKLNIIIEFRKFKLALVPNFHLNWQFCFFFDQICRKRVFGLKQKKWAPYIFYISLHIQISLVQNFNSNWQFWFFGPDLHKKVFPVENTKSEHHHGILHIWISLDIKFQLKLKFWVFGPNLPKKVFQVENRTSNPWRRSVCFLCSKRWFNCCF